MPIGFSPWCLRSAGASGIVVGMDDVLADLDALLAKASPLPWGVDPPWSLVGGVKQYLGDFASGDVPNQAREANAAYAALAVNHLRPLVAALRFECQWLAAIAFAGADLAGCKALAELGRDLDALKEGATDARAEEEG